jgi:hypothetical protein
MLLLGNLQMLLVFQGFITILHLSSVLVLLPKSSQSRHVEMLI